MSYPNQTAVTPTTRIELYLKCNDLHDSQLLGKTSSQAIVEIFENAGWKEIGRTEVVRLANFFNQNNCTFFLIII